MMQVNIVGRYSDKYGVYNLPSLCSFKNTDEEAVKWGCEQISYLQQRFGFNVLSLAVVEADLRNGNDRVIKEIL